MKVIPELMTGASLLAKAFPHLRRGHGSRNPYQPHCVVPGCVSFNKKTLVPEFGHEHFQDPDYACLGWIEANQRVAN